MRRQRSEGAAASTPAASRSAAPPSLPKGGGAVRGIDESFSVNPATGTASQRIPLPISPGRSGFTPELALTYDSGDGNGPFGLGWQVRLPSISRRTDRGLPRYRDSIESDTFLLTGADDLVPVLLERGGVWERRTESVTEAGDVYEVERYRPRVEGLFARIERWRASSGDIHFRAIAKDGVRSIFGRSANARIADPGRPRRVFQWLLEEQRDLRGNVAVYVYKAEDGVGVHASAVEERRRVDAGTFAQRYVKRVLYGNRAPNVAADFLFELCFDYGEHDRDDPQPLETVGLSWDVRSDAHSTYRPGFEVRTYRLCRRLLMFHHVPEYGVDGLVRSMAFEYDESPVVTLLHSVTESARVVRAGHVVERSLPPLTFGYTLAAFAEQVDRVEPPALEGWFHSDAQHRWIDLDGEGLPGALFEEAGQWFYKRNLGGGRFAPPRPVGSRPMTEPFPIASANLADLDGDGQSELFAWDSTTPGFFGRAPDGSWQPFTPFQSRPNLDFADPDLRFVDASGDGRPDVLVTESDRVCFFPSLGRGGLGALESVATLADEERGPAVLFSDPEHRVFLADMSGDGLADIVRIRNGEVSYWPNLGYGRFGRRVEMASPPHFDDPATFDPRRIHLADLDGSGTSDIVYVGRTGATVWVNQAGNRFGPPRRITGFSGTDDLDSVAILDLLGRGTPCLVFASPLAGAEPRRVRYVDLLQGVKPYLLRSVQNGAGHELSLVYTSSTSFYLADRATGRPWATRLPFPVHVVARCEHRDAILGSSLVSTYRYRHGTYDGIEREFRGFAYVEHLDAETVGGGDETLALPPVITKVWTHTGVFVDARNLSEQLAHEYYQGDRHPQAAPLERTVLPEGLTARESRDACRALKGQVLREEVYALDDTALAAHPYRVLEKSYTVHELQPSVGTRGAVFLPRPREEIELHYERERDDPRIKHTMTLETDRFGNVTRRVTVAYARRARAGGPALPAPQSTPVVTAIEATFTSPIDTASAYRVPLPAEASSFELIGFTVPSDDRVSFDAANSGSLGATAIANDASPGSGVEKRWLENTRTTYYDDALASALPLGQTGALGFEHTTYRMTFMPGLVDRFGGWVGTTELAAAGYVAGQTIATTGDLRDDALYAPSPRLGYLPRTPFVSPTTSVDPFGNASTLRYDAPFELFLIETTDPATNVTRVEHDYRVLKPFRLTDANGNRSEVAFDALGRVVGSVLSGKSTEPVLDSFATFEPDLDPSAIHAFMADPIGSAVALLGSATVRFVYDSDAYLRANAPLAAASIARRVHGAPMSPVDVGFVYTDGFGRELLKKARAGPADRLHPTPRWVGSGWTSHDNKGNKVRTYEPYFSDTHAFEIRPVGVTATLFYDPLGRRVGTLHPNKTFDKIIFDPWTQTTWDVVDTILTEPVNDEHLGTRVAKLTPDAYEPSWFAARDAGSRGPDEQASAAKASKIAKTPTTAHLDVLGRAFLTVADNGDEGGAPELHETRVDLDVAGNPLRLIDPRRVVALTSSFDMLGRTMTEVSADSGARWELLDVADKPVRSRDGDLTAAETYEVLRSYDALRRPVQVHARRGQELRLVEEYVYGEGLPDDQERNLRGRLAEQRDGAGVLTLERYDFKGNAARTTRVLTASVETPDWSQVVSLSGESFTVETEYDAQNRVTRVHDLHDATDTHHVFDDGGRLDRVEVAIRGAAAQSFVRSIDYDAKGQRLLTELGNGVLVRRRYEEDTFRLSTLTSTRGGRTLQSLSYTYDPAGNVVHVADGAHPDVFRAGSVASADQDFTYDALYRLVRGSGREHVDLAANPLYDPNDAPRRNPTDPNALRPYTQVYDYDMAGNIELVTHQLGTSPTGPTLWKRRHRNDALSNRLLSTELPGDAATDPLPPRYRYDARGNMVSMPHLDLLEWDWAGRLVKTVGQGMTTLYAYDASGARVRKWVSKNDGARTEERIYAGGYEVFRQRDGSTFTLERESVHVSDGDKRFVLVETLTRDGGAVLTSPESLQRYQLDNLLGSSTLELDENGRTISYEEYHPYGTTSFQGGSSVAEVKLKRYRYTGKERDEETGLACHGARYFAPWLARWTSPDPAGTADGPNLYVYVSGRPATLIDPTGHAGAIPKEVAGLLETLTEWARFITDLPGMKKLSPQDQGRVLDFLLQGAVKASNGTDVHFNTVYNEFTKEGRKFNIDLTFGEARLRVDIKLSPNSQRELQNAVHVDAAVARGDMLGYVYPGHYEAYNLGKTATQAERAAASEVSVVLKRSLQIAKDNPRAFLEGAEVASRYRWRMVTGILRRLGPIGVFAGAFLGFAGIASAGEGDPGQPPNGAVEKLVAGLKVGLTAVDATGSAVTTIGMWAANRAGDWGVYATLKVGSRVFVGLGLLWTALDLTAALVDSLQEAYINSLAETYPPPMAFPAPHDMGVP